MVSRVKHLVQGRVQLIDFRQPLGNPYLLVLLIRRVALSPVLLEVHLAEEPFVVFTENYYSHLFPTQESRYAFEHLLTGC